MNFAPYLNGMEESWSGLCAKVLKRPYTEPRVKILQFVVIVAYASNKGLFPFHKSLTIARRSRDSPRNFVKPWKWFIFRPRYYKNSLWRQGYFAPTIAHWQIAESDSSKWSPLSSCLILINLLNFRVLSRPQMNSDWLTNWRDVI